MVESLERMLWSHLRQVTVIAEKGVVRYTIPLGLESKAREMILEVPLVILEQPSLQLHVSLSPGSAAVGEKRPRVEAQVQRPVEQMR